MSLISVLPVSGQYEAAVSFRVAALVFIEVIVARTQGQTEGRLKEEEIVKLIQALRSVGVTVRREKLKSGHGWRTSSGTCRLSDSKLVFVDRKLPIDEQLLFLRDATTRIGISTEPSLPNTNVVQSLGESSTSAL